MKRILSSLALALTMLVSATASAATTNYRSTMSGPSEAPPNPSPGAGIATIVIDDVANTLSLSMPFFDLVADTVAGHLHCCTASPLTSTAGIAIPFGDLASGVRSGMYQRVFDLTSAATYGPDFLAANGGTADLARFYLLQGITGNQSYLNIHTTQFPGGEIRGFLVAAPVPEPSTWLMLGVGLAAVGYCVRARRREVDQA